MRIEPEEMPEMASAVVVAFVVVELPKIVRLPLIVEDAEEINPASVESPETESVLWSIEEPVVVAPPRMVRPVPLVAPPIVEEAFTMMPMVEVGAK